MTDLHAAVAEAERQLRTAGIAFLAAHAAVSQVKTHLATLPPAAVLICRELDHECPTPAACRQGPCAASVRHQQEASGARLGPAEAQMLPEATRASVPPPPAATDMPAPTSPAALAGLPWTEEREAKLRALWSQAASDRSILATLNQLAGTSLTWPAICTRASKLGLGKRGIAPTDTWRPGAVTCELDLDSVTLPPGFQPDGKLTEARARALVAGWHRYALSGRRLRAILAGLPGDKFGDNDSTLYSFARRLGLPSQRFPDGAPPSDPVPEPAAPPPVAPQPATPQPEPVAEAPPPTPPEQPVEQEEPPAGSLPPTQPEPQPLPAPAPVAAALPTDALPQHARREAHPRGFIIAAPKRQPSPETAPELADAAVDRKHQEAKAMLFRGIPAAMVASQTKLNLNVVYRLQGEVRADRQRASEEIAAQ